MVKRVKTVGLVCCIAIIYLLLIIYNQKTIVPQTRYTGLNHNYLVEDYLANLSLSPSALEILYGLKFALEHETKDYIFANGATLKDYTLATNGKPLRSIIFTTWRSGSTFLGDILNAVPGTYYHFEPLTDYGLIQIRGSPLAESAITALKNLLNCEYDEYDTKRYLIFRKWKHVVMFYHNTRLLKRCVNFHLCYDPNFLNGFCKLFPFQAMKITRMRVKFAEELLKDESLNVKIVLLIRDPRGTIESRKHLPLCKLFQDCIDPNLLCADLVSDYTTAAQLLQNYPNTFKVIRYEDLSINPYEMTKELFEFYGLQFHPEVAKFLESHTKFNKGDWHSTFRDSKSAPFHWRTDLSIPEIQNIEKICGVAMKLWGYVSIMEAKNITTFNPLIKGNRYRRHILSSTIFIKGTYGIGNGNINMLKEEDIDASSMIKKIKKNV